MTEPYYICAATDCGDGKVNLLFSFSNGAPSSVEALLSKCAYAFSNYNRNLGQSAPFEISFAAVYNDAQDSWERLEHPSQLLVNSQLYLFQPTYDDAPSTIPDPVPADEYLTGYVESSQAKPSPLSTSPRTSSTSATRPVAAAPPVDSGSAQSRRRTTPERYNPDQGSGTRAAPDSAEPRKALTRDLEDPAVNNGDGVSSTRRREPYSGNSPTPPAEHVKTTRHQAGDVPRSEPSQPTYRRSASPEVFQPPRGAGGGAYAGYTAGTGRQPTLSSSAGRETSILQEERDRMEEKFQMPLDELRAVLRAEMDELDRALTPSTSPARATSYESP